MVLLISSLELWASFNRKGDKKPTLQNITVKSDRQTDGETDRQTDGATDRQWQTGRHWDEHTT